jgi:site-specific DNA recombinase
MDEGVQLLELARNAQNLFAKQEPREKRRLLNFLLSNCTWEDGEVVATFRQPFDLLAETNVSAAGAGAGQMASSVKTEIGSPGRTGTARVSWDCHAPSYHDAREAVIRPSPIFW